MQASQKHKHAHLKRLIATESERPTATGHPSKEREETMYTLFEYLNGGNPYITTTNNRLFEMLTKYNTEQTSPQGFTVLSEAIPPKTYREKQEALRNIAIAWQSDFSQFAYSWGELANWGDFFAEMGKKYGLISEFKENAII